MAHYSIKDLERLSGIKAHTIRIWEKRYGVIDPSRTDSNIRIYSDADLKKILNISILNRYGVKISHIAVMDEKEIAERIFMISRDSSDYASLIENLVISMVELNEENFNKLLTRAIMQIGFEDTIRKIVFPLLEKIGLLWQTGAINPAQEHFIANLIRQKIIVGIDSVIPVQNKEPKHFLLFLPEGELHELGLLFYNYILQKKGHKVTYLGQWVPMKEMAEASSVLTIDYLLTSISAVHSGNDLRIYLENLSKTFPENKIFISGYQTKTLGTDFPENVIIINTDNDLFKRIS